MARDWQELTNLTGSKEFSVARVKMKDTDIAIEGDFALPPLAKLNYEDQVFVAMFVKVHGSIKEMEQAFSVSYPTIKARLNRIGQQLGLVAIEEAAGKESVLRQLERGEISAQEALDKLAG
jgi:hypothetical protein